MSKRQPSTRQRTLTGLIGAPIARSASPAMHEQAAAALGVHCPYQLAGAGREELRALLDGVRHLGFASVNVTFPHKEVVVDLLLIEQNARSALEISDFGIVLELGQTSLVDKAERVLMIPVSASFSWVKG